MCCAESVIQSGAQGRVLSVPSCLSSTESCIGSGAPVALVKLNHLGLATVADPTRRATGEIKEEAQSSGSSLPSSIELLGVKRHLLDHGIGGSPVLVIGIAIVRERNWAFKIGGKIFGGPSKKKKKKKSN